MFGGRSRERLLQGSNHGERQVVCRRHDIYSYGNFVLLDAIKLVSVYLLALDEKISPIASCEWVYGAGVVCGIRIVQLPPRSPLPTADCSFITICREKVSIWLNKQSVGVSLVPGGVSSKVLSSAAPCRLALSLSVAGQCSGWV